MKRRPVATVYEDQSVVKAESAQPKQSKRWISPSLLAYASRKRYPQVSPFRLPDHPPRAVPKEHTLAMDQAFGGDFTWAGNALAASPGIAYESAFAEGLAFLGYAYLAQLAQRSEYRRMVEIIAQEMTRKWIRLQAISGDMDKTARIKQLAAELDRLKVQHAFRKMAEHDGFFGRAHLFLDFGTNNREELKVNIGNGRNETSKAKVRPDSLEMIKPIEAVWVYPIDYNSIDPLSADWYKPSRWFVLGKEIHASRLLTFVGREVPDLLKPAYSFGGLSLTQMAKPYVDNWLRTRQSVADLIHSFSVFVLKTDLHESLQADGDFLFKRAELFNNLRDNKNLMMLDKASEEFENVDAPLGSLDKLQAQVQEHMASVSGIPLVKLLGITPNGLNASTEGETRTFYDGIHAYQELLFTDNLRKVISFVMLSLWGEIDEDITFSFVPLWSLDAKEEAEVRKLDAETDRMLIENGVIWPKEARKRVAADPSTPYSSLAEGDVPIKPEDTPNLKQEEEQGLEPGHPQHLQGGNPGEGGGGSNGGGKPNGKDAEDDLTPSNPALLRQAGRPKRPGRNPREERQLTNGDTPRPRGVSRGSRPPRLDDRGSRERDA